MFDIILWIKFALLLLSFGVESVYPLSCAIEGVCNGVSGSAVISDSLDNCVLSGRTLEGVTWVSYNLGSGICTGLEDCSSIDAEVPSHLSSEVSCPICSAAGECSGSLLNDVLVNSTEECRGSCQSQSYCNWFAFNMDLGICILLETCENINSDPQWISGEVICSPPPPSTKENILWIDNEYGTVRLGKGRHKKNVLKKFFFIYLFTPTTFR